METISNSKPQWTAPKPLGVYLVESGLLTQSQIEVALKDQSLTSLRFGDIIAARGWVKAQTIEYLMDKIVIPERQHINQQDLGFGLSRQPRSPKTEGTVKKSRQASEPEGGVHWVG